MYLFDVFKYGAVWNNFIDRSDPDNKIPHLTDTEWNVWLENELEKYNGIDIPDNESMIYFRSEEDAMLFIILFS